MKKLTLIILFTIAAAYVAFGQCQFPQLGIGQGLHAVDSATIQESHTRCTACPTEGVVSWDLVGDVNWQFTIFSGDSNLVTVQITKSCDLLLWDTCGILPPISMGAVWAFTKSFSVYGDCQVHVNGSVGQTIIIDVKGTATNHEQLDDVLIDLNTCTLPTSTTNTTPTPRRLMEFDGHTWRQVTATRPNMLYKEF